MSARNVVVLQRPCEVVICVGLDGDIHGNPCSKPAILCSPTLVVRHAEAKVDDLI